MIMIKKIESLELYNNTNTSCAICLEDFDDYETSDKNNICYLECKHRYHTDCVSEWYNHYLNKYDTKCPCPLCKHEIDNCVYIV